MLVSCEAGFIPALSLPSSRLPTNINNNTYLLKPCNPTRRFSALPTRNSTKPRLCAVESNGVSLKTHHSAWEDPVYGSDSDLDSEDEDDWVTEAEASLPSVSLPTIVTRTEDDIIKEVERLLEPEERAILDQNETPLLSKILTPKWGVLHSLALSGQISIMDKLLAHGVHIDAVDKDGFTALHKAIIGKREAVISHLLRKGANPNLRDKSGATPLHHAVQVGAMQTVKLLIKYNVDVNVADDDGWTPLHVAIQSRCRDIAKVLLLNGADKTRRTNDGKTALDLSLCYGKDFKSYDLAKLVKLVPADNPL